MSDDSARLDVKSKSIKSRLRWKARFSGRMGAHLLVRAQVAGDDVAKEADDMPSVAGCCKDRCMQMNA